MDPDTIVFGGYGLTSNGREEFVREFARNFIPLPPVKFDTPFPDTQPVTFRVLKKNGRTYFYIVNDTPMAAQVKIFLAGGAGAKIYSNNDLSFKDISKDAGGHAFFQVDMPNYGLKSFESETELAFTSMEVRVSDAEEAVLKNRITELENILKRNGSKGEGYAKKLWSALGERRYRDLSIDLEQPDVWKLLTAKGRKE